MKSLSPAKDIRAALLTLKNPPKMRGGGALIDDYIEAVEHARKERANGGRTGDLDRLTKDLGRLRAAHPDAPSRGGLPGKRGDIVDMASFRSTPELFQKNIDLVRAYPNMRIGTSTNSHDTVAKAFKSHVVDNLLALHDAVPEHIRQRSKLWYDGARKITDDWMQKYGLPDHSIAGALAALSPQKDWYQNVSLAQRVLDSMKSGDNFYRGQVFDPGMEQSWAARPSLQKPEYSGLVDMLRGKSLHDLDGMQMDPMERATAKAMWIRMHDETYRDPSHPIVTPEGGFGEPVKTDAGTNAKVGWGSLTEISKAVRAIEAANDPAQLSQLMGERHKVRNFYNNILSPNSKHGDVTIDTHAVAAGLMRPLSGNSVEVSHNFGNYAGKGIPNAGGSALTGVSGLYPLYADAYREAAKQRGVKPREMQSITWEAIRGLFPDTWKTADNGAKVDAIWNRYRNGKLTQKAARNQIIDLAGGIRNPTWFVGTDGANGSAAGSSALPGSAVHGAGTGTADGRTGGGPPAAVSQALADAGLERARGGRAKEADDIWWHGSGSGDLRGGKQGLHLGTKAAATDALNARIGWPAEGTWDGTRKYGETLLAGKKRLNSWGPYNVTGHNVDAPDEDYYPHQHPKGLPPVSGRDISMDPGWTPSIRPFRIVGNMNNRPYTPHPDSRANGYMQAALRKGNAKNGYYYRNDGEDHGSISAVVPGPGHVELIDEKLQKARGGSINHSPTEAQKSAGNYAKRKISFQGLPITIENAKGSTRSGVDEHGKAWSCRLPADYGYIRRTEGADGDHVDAYVGPNTHSELVVLVNQQDHKTKRFDEHKVMLGYGSEREALRDYHAAFSDGKGPARVKSVEVMSLPAFKLWLKSGKTTKPAHGPSIVDKALRLVASKGIGAHV